MEDQIYKGYKIERNRQFGTFEVRAIGKGALPKILNGSFTKDSIVKNLIDSYLKNKKV